MVYFFLFFFILIFSTIIIILLKSTESCNVFEKQKKEFSSEMPLKVSKIECLKIYYNLDCLSKNKKQRMSLSQLIYSTKKQKTKKKQI